MFCSVVGFSVAQDITESSIRGVGRDKLPFSNIFPLSSKSMREGRIGLCAKGDSLEVYIYILVCLRLI